MLILSRKAGEGVLVAAAGGVRVRVIEIGKNRVRLGVEADRSVAVYREELVTDPAELRRLCPHLFPGEGR